MMTFLSIIFWICVSIVGFFFALYMFVYYGAMWLHKTKKNN